MLNVREGVKHTGNFLRGLVAFARHQHHIVGCGLAQGCGNGGGAANAQYFSSRMLNHFEVERPGLATIALNADSTTITAIANFGHFDQTYSKQVQALGQAGDRKDVE